MIPLLAAVLSLPAPARAAAPDASPASVRFKTADGWTLAALYQPPRKGEPAAILVHGVASDKHEWDAFAGRLRALGWGTLAIDLRGHGESRAGPEGPGDFRTFDRDGTWPALEGDLTAAVAFLKKKGLRPGRIGLIGASIGANLASRVFAAAPSLGWAVLLSPGGEYRGVALSSDLEGRRVLMAASPEDGYAYRTAVEAASRPGGPVFLEAPSGHGVQMFKDEVFVGRLLAWLEKAAEPAKTQESSPTAD